MNALDGIRVLDFTHAISGPTCTLMLRQLGAEVIKIEPRGVGDDFRHYTEHAGLPGMSVPFAAVNAGKRSLTLDLKSPEGRDIALRLADGCDIAVENFRPGVLARLELGPQALRERNPRLIVASISGFGQDGPLRDWGAYDHIAQAMSGMAMMNADDRGPRKVGMPIIDSFSGYLAALAILAALRKRDITGEGEYVDIAMLDSALKLIATGVAVWSYTGSAPPSIGNRGYRMVATAEFYPTANGWIALGANHQHQVEAMFAAFGRSDMLADARFADHAGRTANYEAVKAWLTDYLASRPASEVETELTAAGVPAAMIRDVGQIATHPHLAQRDLFEPVSLPGREEPLTTPGPGFHSEASGVAPQVPVLGADTDAVLGELGYEPDEIADLRRRGVV